MQGDETILRCSGQPRDDRVKFHMPTHVTINMPHAVSHIHCRPPIECVTRCPGPSRCAARQVGPGPGERRAVVMHGSSKQLWDGTAAACWPAARHATSMRRPAAAPAQRISQSIEDTGRARAGPVAIVNT